MSTTRFLRGPLILLAALLPLATSGAAAATSHPSDQAWVAHSAYGLQISVPGSWDVAFFGSCPGRTRGTLLIGTPSVEDFCAATPSDTTIVTMRPENSASVPVGQGHDLVVHGIQVVSHVAGAFVIWNVRAEGVVLTAMGPRSSAVLRTLGVATPHAQPAPGVLQGTENIETLRQLPVTGPVAVVRLGTHGPGLPPAQAYDGQFSDTIPPGTYRLTGHSGNVPCTSLTTTVLSGRTIDLAPLDCQGF